MDRPPDNDEPPVEGRIFRFPRLWVPPDGIEPLNQSPAETDASNGVDCELESSIDSPSQTERTAFEAGEFWERGDTQEFVGVAAGSAPSATSADEADAITGAHAVETRPSLEPPNTIGNGDGSAGRGVTWKSRRATSSARLARARVAGVAVLAFGSLVGGGIAIAAALSSAPNHRQGTAAAELVRHGVWSPGTRLAATGALLLPAVNWRRPDFAATHPATRGAGRSSHQGPAVTPVQPVRYAQPTPSTSTSAPSASQASSSGGSSSGAPAPPPAQAQTAQSAPHEAAPPARPSPSGALTCISNCG